jgi:hypothetical protein
MQPRGRKADMTRHLLCSLLFVVLASGQATPVRIGQHRIGETLDDWHRLESDVGSQPSADANLSTEIAPHRAGETFAEWLSLNQMDLDEICGSHKRSDTTANFKVVCKKLSRIRDTGQGEFYSATQLGTFGWRFLDGKVSDYSVSGQWRSTNLAKVQNIRTGLGNELVTNHDNRSYTWKFSNGKLSEVAVTPDWTAIYRQYNEEGISRHPEVVPAFQEEVDFLTQTYGEPSKTVKAPYQNAYGAQWERLQLVWYAPDGIQIVAFERTGFNQQGQLELVSFQSKDSLSQTLPTKPNPYK